jgi:hypothetical protein
LGIFNTAYVARHVFAPLDSMLKLCLGQLLTRLEILCRKIHCAGSDANFALCALLLLAAESYRGGGGGNGRCHKGSGWREFKRVGFASLLCPPLLAIASVEETPGQGSNPLDSLTRTGSGDVDATNPVNIIGHTPPLLHQLLSRVLHAEPRTQPPNGTSLAHFACGICSGSRHNTVASLER